MLPGALGGQRKVVGDQQDGCSELGCHRLQMVEDLALHRHIQRGRRLVGDQQSRLPGQPDRDQRALAHPARQLMRVPVRADCRIVHADLGQQLHRPCPGDGDGR